MSTNDTHITYIERCLTLASYGLGRVKTNPLVGSVIVHNDRIISEGYHQQYGHAHAERNAINNLSNKEILPESTIYVSLEPCNHHGKTPPCTKLIIESGIKKVVIAQLDPNPLMSGKSIALLKSHGIEVTLNILADKASYLNRSFMVNQLEHMPFVMLKFAESEDGYIGKKGKQIWLSNQPAKMLTHKWRSEYDAIMVGTETAIIDNPKLNNRLFSGRSPIRVIIDRNERIPKSHYLLSDELETWIYTYKDKYRFATDKKVSIKIAQQLDKIHELNWILKDLYQRGIGKLMVEGGKKLHQSIIDQQLWHQANIIKTPISLDSGIRSPKLNGQVISKKSIIDNKVLIINSLKLTKLLKVANG